MVIEQYYLVRTGFVPRATKKLSEYRVPRLPSMRMDLVYYSPDGGQHIKFFFVQHVNDVPIRVAQLFVALDSAKIGLDNFSATPQIFKSAISLFQKSCLMEFEGGKPVLTWWVSLGNSHFGDDELFTIDLFEEEQRELASYAEEIEEEEENIVLSDVWTDYINTMEDTHDNE